MQFLTLLFIPHIIIWILTRSRRTYRWLLIVATFTIQLFAILPMVIIFIVVSGKPPAVSSVMLASVSNSAGVGLLPYHAGESPQPLNELHSRGGEWAGRDYIRACGTSIIAPFNGSVTRGGNGAIDGWDNTYMYIQSDDGRYEMLIMHSDFVLSAGDKFSQGQEIGKTNTHGYSSECHEHISLKVDGQVVDPENYRGGDVQQLASLGVTMTMDYPLRISWYDPSLGGTNCDGDCTTMASGDKVASWIGGRGGVYAAACPRSDGWHHGQRFELDGVIYECRDTGGWINCYQPGMYDPALRRNAEMAYCWVDLLNGSQYQYGSLASDWSLIR